jgi:hypothetical protein
MNWNGLDGWLASSSIVTIAILALVSMLGAAGAGTLLRRYYFRRWEEAPGDDSREGHIVSAMLGLLALLLAFTFSLTIDRFETRRERVVDEANAIGAAYRYTQLIPEPNRERISELLLAYVDNRIELAELTFLPASSDPRLRKNDLLLDELWLEAEDALPTIEATPYADTYLLTVNELVVLDSVRKAERSAHIPMQVHALLLAYMIVTSAFLGFVLTRHTQIAMLMLIILLAMSYTVIIDIDRPTIGTIRESQQPMKLLKAEMRPPRRVSG